MRYVVQLVCSLQADAQPSVSNYLKTDTHSAGYFLITRTLQNRIMTLITDWVREQKIIKNWTLFAARIFATQLL